ncbi:MAG: YceH family protein [Calditrichia bacterium]
MAEKLNDIEIRILGSLIEKELTTPDYYPLTLNSLTAACNQKSNRSPVVEWDQEKVIEGVRTLRNRQMVIISSAPGQRVRKYEHRFRETFFVSKAEMVLLCELMLRGPQTAGELRTHSARMSSFPDLQEISNLLEQLMDREQPLVVRLPRQPGHKENRFAHLLGAEPEISAEDVIPAASGGKTDKGSARMELLEKEVEDLREELEQLKAEFRQFRQQFES